MADEQGEKTEKPSQQRLKKARERGQIPRSRDLAMALSSLAATAVLGGIGALSVRRLAGFVADGIVRIGSRPRTDLRVEDLLSLIVSGAGLVVAVVGPIAAVVSFVGVLTAVAQGGLVFSAAPLQGGFQRLSPSAGLKKFAPMQAGVETLKACLAATVIAFIGWHVARDLAFDGLRLVAMTPARSAMTGWSYVIRLLWQVGFALLAIGGLDYGVQRYRHWTSLKMTKQELREEAKEHQPGPEIKARVRKISRDMVRRRMLTAVPNATVVITNPTHFAVALEYRRDKSAAPIVVAKGQDLLAARIRELARQHGVPIVENPPLARALYREAEVGEMIPGPLFSAVAEILAYLIRIKQLSL